jgi:uncharacterized protein YcaQ
MTPKFPVRAAAALFLERQWLDRPRGRRLTARTLEGFAVATGGIQLDSINVVDRAHHLTLWSRFGPYKRESLRRLIEKERVLFEYWAHVACLVATSDFPAWRRVMIDYQRRHKGWVRFLKKHKPLIAVVENAIRERGPLGNADFREPGKKVQGGWWNWRPATHALDYLWMSGRTSVHSRVHFHKRFDLTERVVPAEVLGREPLTAEAFRRWHLDRSLSAMGAATETDLRMYLTYPRFEISERKATLREAVHDGSVVEVELEGDKGKWFTRREDLDALAAAGRRRTPSSGSALLAPFDSFLWHRERTRRLFGYDYRIEVYVPGPRRTHGYYSLPILVDGHLIGRVDTKTHRQDGVLELKNVHFEPWFVSDETPPVNGRRPLDRDATVASLADAAWSLAAHTECRKVKLTRVEPSRMRAALRRAIDHAAGAAQLVPEPVGTSTRPRGE